MNDHLFMILVRPKDFVANPHQILVPLAMQRAAWIYARMHAEIVAYFKRSLQRLEKPQMIFWNCCLQVGLDFFEDDVGSCSRRHCNPITKNRRLAAELEQSRAAAKISQNFNNVSS